VTAREDRNRLAIVVHELRSPVAALAAVAEAASRGGSDDRARRRELVRLAIAASRGIERLVADANVASVTFEEVDIGRLVADAVAAARLRGATVDTEIQSDLDSVDADPERLRQALDNLIANAIVHTADGTAISVGARDVDGAVVVSVSDLGGGVAPDDQERIFEPGVRLDRRRAGSGLGLSVTRAIVEAHGGSISVESDLGVGSTFTLVLPGRA